MAPQGKADGFSTKWSHNGRFRATMWPPAACRPGRVGSCLREHGLTQARLSAPTRDIIAYTQSRMEVAGMEAAAVVKKIRSEGGTTRKELARLADVSPSTIGRIERGEMDPTWGTMQKILTSTGYQINGRSVVSSGDTSAIRAASAVFEPMFRRTFASTVEKAMTSWIDSWKSTNKQWSDRWKRTGWLVEEAKVDDLVAIAVSAGNAGKIARRTGARIPVEVEGGWRSLIDRLKES